MLILGDGEVETDEAICLTLARPTGHAAIDTSKSYMVLTLLDRGIAGGPQWSCVKGSACHLSAPLGTMPRVAAGDHILISPQCGSSLSLSGTTSEQREATLFGASRLAVTWVSDFVKLLNTIGCQHKSTWLQQHLKGDFCYFFPKYIQTCA